MGYIAHHAILVTSWDNPSIVAAHRCASSLGCIVSEITKDSVNGYRSFFVAPDGSKEGWAESDKGNEQRDAFVQWMEDSTLYFAWAEVQYGDEYGDQRVLRSSG